MEDPQINPDSSRGSELVIPDSLQTPFAKPPPYGGVQPENIPPQPPRRLGKRIVKFIIILFVIVAGVIGGYFVLANYFPQYAKYVQPYLGPVLDPVLEQIQPVLDKVGLTKPASPNVNQQVNSGNTTPTPLPGLGGGPQVSGQPSLAGWKTYHNFEYGFEFRYPPNWSILKIISERVEGLGTNILLKLPSKDGSQYSLVCLFAAYDTMAWNELQQEDTTGKPILITERRNITFGWSCGHDDYGYSGFEEYNNAVSNNQLDKINSGQIAGPFQEFKNLILPTFKFSPDTDGDGLPDAEEPKYKTDPNNRDTDGDTWPDGEEVQNGYNPLGPGRAQ